LNLVAVGRIAPQKDYSTLILALAKVKIYQKVHLKIVGGTGDAAELNKVQQLITKLKLDNDIELVGYTDAVNKYYESADIFVLSSAWEGFGNVIVEAMAFGLPVISTDCNYGPSEILEDGKYGRLAGVGDDEKLADLIMLEAKQPLTTRAALVQRSSEFSENIIAGQYQQLIEEVVNEF